MDPYYIVVFDKEIGYCRLFRTDSENCPANAIPLWEGYNLEVGYEAMVRKNLERREIPSYHVSERINENGKKIYKIFKESPKLPWISVELVNEYAQATEKLKSLCAGRNAFKKEVELRQKSLMNRLKMKGKVFRLDTKGKKYVMWLMENGALNDNERENILWLKENGILKLSNP
jgi:hypothetical protein